MNRKLFVLSLMGTVMLFASSAFASYIDQLTDLSAEWVGNPTRTAATDSVDGVMYNPAGLSTVADGLYVHFSNQSIDNNNTTEVEDASYPGEKRYDTHKPSKFVPAFYANYKQDNWAIFGGLCIYGGGGSVFWGNGTPNLNAAVEGVDLAFGWGASSSKNKYWNSSTPTYGPNVSVNMLSMFPAITLGGSVKVNDMISVALGGRVIEGSQTITIEATQSGVGAGFERDKVYDAEWTAQGYSGIIGVDVKPVKDLTLAATFESMAKMNWKVNVKEDDSTTATGYSAFSYGGGAGVASVNYNGEHALSSMSGYTDGRKYRFDLPAKLQLGAEYAILEKLKAAISGVVYLSNFGTYTKPTASTGTTTVYNSGTTGLPVNAPLASYKQNVITYNFKPAWEVGVGFDWEFLKGISWTGGVNYDEMNMKSEDINEVMNKLSLWNVGTGIKVRTQENLNLMVSYMHNFYISEENSNQTKTVSTTTGASTYYKTKYSKYANDLAFSIEYKFL